DYYCQSSDGGNSLVF
nr:immunoglobulin light chain junction region [Macaca mulatta]